MPGSAAALVSCPSADTALGTLEAADWSAGAPAVAGSTHVFCVAVRGATSGAGAACLFRVLMRLEMQCWKARNHRISGHSAESST